MTPLTIAIVGFGPFGQFLASRYTQHGHRVLATSRRDYSTVASSLNVEFYPTPDLLLDQSPDVVVLATSIISLHAVLSHFPVQRLSNTLVVDVLSVKLYPRHLLLRLLPQDAHILCTHPMFGPVSGAGSWEGLPFMYDKVRIAPHMFPVCDAYLGTYEQEGCRMVSMNCEEHDRDAASSQFLTHMTGRILDDMHVHETLIDTAGFNSLLGVMDSSTKDSFDLFYGLYKYNPIARSELNKLEMSLRHIRQQLEGAEEKERRQQKSKEVGKADSAKNEVLRTLNMVYKDAGKTKQRHDELFVSAVAVCFVRRMARRARPREEMGEVGSLDSGF